MIATVTVSGETGEATIDEWITGLERFGILGPKSNIPVVLNMPFLELSGRRGALPHLHENMQAGNQ